MSYTSWHSREKTSKGMSTRSLVILSVVLCVSVSISLGLFTSIPRLFVKYFVTQGSNREGLGGDLCDNIFGYSGDCYRHLEEEEDGAPVVEKLYDDEHGNGNDGSKLKTDRLSLSSTYLQGTSVSLRYKERLPVNKDVKREAVAAMNIALDLQNKGKTEKAMKVFQHAVALDPSHADILTAYGEFLEWHVKDVVKADHLYQIALEHSPDHGKALKNRKRTGPIVEEIDQARFSRVDRKRSYLYTVPHSHPGLRRAKREAYFAHIYHTNAIEGNTLTLSQTRSIVETRMAVGGKSLREQNEVLGLDSALSYVNSTLVGRIGRLTLQNILDIHLRVLGFVDPTEAGRFRNNQVFVGDFVPPPASELQEHMDQLVEWLNSEEASSLHPVEFAALAHYRLVAIHPFYDGNGRTSRLLMNLILMQAGFPPVSIEVHDRLKYYETLEQANNGDIRPFIRFIAECTERTLDGYIEVLADDESELTLPPSFKRRKSTLTDRVIYMALDDEDEEEEEGEGSVDGTSSSSSSSSNNNIDKCDQNSNDHHEDLLFSKKCDSNFMKTVPEGGNFGGGDINSESSLPMS